MTSVELASPQAADSLNLNEAAHPKTACPNSIQSSGAEVVVSHSGSLEMGRGVHPDVGVLPARVQVGLGRSWFPRNLAFSLGNAGFSGACDQCSELTAGGLAQVSSMLLTVTLGNLAH